MKVLLILVDGMRPDALTDVPEAQEMIRQSASALNAQTVNPSITLPCHMSLFHSVDPTLHGITNNVYRPPVRPVDGIFETVYKSGKRTAFFYGWQQLQDLCRPGYLTYAKYYSWKDNKTTSNRILVDDCIAHLNAEAPDFAFLYLAWTDEVGHEFGWMTPEYLECVKDSWKDIQRVRDSIPEEYAVMVIADHGGHDRTHGYTYPEDMTIPVIIHGGPFAAGSDLGDNVSIKDIAPTITDLLNAPTPAEWEGKSLVPKN